MLQPSLRRVAVIGTGTIGASWAAFFLARGLTVAASDPAPQAESRLRQFVNAAWPGLQRLGADASPPQHRLSFHGDSEAAVADADFVQESAPEREPLKREIFRQLDAVTPASVIIVSSSSGLLISRLQAGCRHPERFIIAHPFNPPHLMPLVEVVGGNQTEPQIVERALAIYAALGKRPIHVRREVTGHIANRLQAALWREAVHLVAEGVASADDIDTAISEGPGIRLALMGPLMIMHLGGGQGGIAHVLDNWAGPLQSWWDDLGQPQLTPLVRQKLIDAITAEVAGRKIEDLAAERDRLLIEILAVKRGMDA